MCIGLWHIEHVVAWLLHLFENHFFRNPDICWLQPCREVTLIWKIWTRKAECIVVESILMLLKLWGHIACWMRPIELRQCRVYFPNSMTWCCSLVFSSLETFICTNIDKSLRCLQSSMRLKLHHDVQWCLGTCLAVAPCQSLPSLAAQEDEQFLPTADSPSPDSLKGAQHHCLSFQDPQGLSQGLHCLVVASV